MKVVLDTNVLISGLLSPYGACSEVLNYVFAHAVICINYQTLAEYREVLLRSKFGFDKVKVEKFISLIEQVGFFVPVDLPPKEAEVILDPFDRNLYSLAVKAQVDFFITGNKRHFPKRKWIVSPREFLNRIG